MKTSTKFIRQFGKSRAWFCGALMYYMLLHAGAYNTVAQTLNPGDIAVIGINTSYNLSVTAPIGPDEFAIVMLAEIQTGTVIKITDRGWNGTTLLSGNTGDGVMSWTVTSVIPYGTVFKFTVTSGTTPAITIAPNTYGTPTIISGWTTTTTIGAMAIVGDQVIIYQGNDVTPSNFVYGFNNSNSTSTPPGNWQSGSTSARDSDLPPGLVNNTALDGTVAASALAFTNNTSPTGFFAVNLVYIGPKIGTKTNLLQAIATRSNWQYTTTTTNVYDLNVGGTHFPGANPVFSVSLPVSLLSFEGIRTSTTDVSLNWKTASETNNKGFEIQQSYDGSLFHNIGYTDGRGNSTSINKYSATVFNTAAAHYRLKQVDFDGRFSYSPAIFVEGIVPTSVSVVPNPFSEKISLTGDRQQLYQATLADMQGALLASYTGQLADLESNLNHSFTSLKAGVYLLYITGSQKTEVLRLVKTD